MKLLQNAVLIRETGEFLISTDVDVRITHKFTNGLTLSIAGGLEHAIREGDLFKLNCEDAYEEYVLMEGEWFEGYITDRLLLGISHPIEKGPIVYRTIKEWAARPGGIHSLREVLASYPLIGQPYRKVIEYWIEELDFL